MAVKYKLFMSVTITVERLRGNCCMLQWQSSGLTKAPAKQTYAKTWSLREFA